MTTPPKAPGGEGKPATKPKKKKKKKKKKGRRLPRRETGQTLLGIYCSLKDKKFFKSLQKEWLLHVAVEEKMPTSQSIIPDSELKLAGPKDENLNPWA